VTLPLHPAANPRMYEGLTANTPGCVAFSLPVQRRNPRNRGSQRLSDPPQPAQRAVDMERRFRARAASGPRLPSRSRDSFRHGITDYRTARFRYAMAGERFGAAPGPAATDKAALFAARVFSDGPTLDAPDCIANHDPAKNRADAERKLRASPVSARIMFGGAPRVAFWPSPHPRIRWTVASPGRATCAHRHTRPPPSRVPKCPTKC
jgi:hypothetical protein